MNILSNPFIHTIQKPQTQKPKKQLRFSAEPKKQEFSDSLRLNAVHPLIEKSGGIQAEDLTVIYLAKMEIPLKITELYKALILNGYHVDLDLLPRSIDKLCRESSLASRFQSLESKMNALYTHAFLVDPKEKEYSHKLQQLLKTSVQTPESIKLTVLIDTKTPFLDQLTKQAIYLEGTPYLVGSSSKAPQILEEHHISKDQLLFSPPRLAYMMQNQKHAFSF